MNRRNFLMLLPLLTFPVEGNEWLYPYAFGRDGYAQDKSPMAELSFAESINLSLNYTGRIDLKIKGKLDSLVGRVHRLGDADNPIFSGLVWRGPRVPHKLTAAAVRVDRLDGEKFTVGLVEIEWFDWKGRAENLTGTVLPSRTPRG